MTLTRERLTYVTLLVSESAWLYAFISILGIAAGSTGSPLSYFAILGLLGLSTLTYSYIRSKEFQAFELFYFGATAGGIILAYLVVAAAYKPDSFTMWWLGDLIDSQHKAQGQAFHGTAGAVIAAGMWFRGIRLAMVPFPEKSLTTSFRLGLFFIGFAAVMDILVEEQLNVFAMVLIFFGAGLAGLNIGHLVPETSASAESKTWPKAIGLAVVGVLVIGLMFGFLQQSFLAFVTSPIRFAFDRVVEGVLLVIGVPGVLVLEFINGVIATVFSRDFEVDVAAEMTPTPTPEPESLDRDFQGVGGGSDQRTPDFLLTLTQIVRYGLVVAAVVVASIFLYVLMRKIGRRLRRGEEADRESLLDEMDFASDIGDLFSDLMSNVRDLFKRGARKVFRLPPGPPGVVEALRLYYQMLTTAEQNAVSRPEHVTPNEFRNDLRRVFANELVDPATHAFNRAHYGDIPSSEEEIARMRSAFRVETPGVPASQKEDAPREREARFETMTSEVTDDPLSRARFDSPSLSEKNWFTGGMSVLLACGGVILFAAVAALVFGLIVLIGGG